MVSEGRDWSKIALALVIGTLVYNLIEAVVALWSGVSADSVALIGFGLDSVIESLAAVAVLWRVRLEHRGASPERIEEGERRVGRFVGVTFLLLAIYVVAEAAWVFVGGEEAEESMVGIVLAIASLVVMPLVAWGKLRAARHLGSEALAAEARETLACAYLSLTLLVGLGAHAWLGWGWADAAAALLMVPWLIKEGWEAWRGEDEDEEEA